MGLLAIIVAYVVWQGALIDAFDQVVLYPLQHYSRVQNVTYGAFWTSQNLFQPLLFPLAAVMLLFVRRCESRNVLCDPQWRTLCTFALVGFAGCFPRPDAVHIGFCIPLVLPLLAAQFRDDLGRNVVTFASRLIASMMVVLPAVSLLAAATLSVGAPLVQTAVGKVRIAVGDGTRDVISYFLGKPQTGKVFFYPYDPLLPYLIGRNHPARLDVLVPQYSTPDQYLEVCRQVMDEADWVVFDTEISQPEFYRAVFPAMTDSSPREKVAFEEVLQSSFITDKSFQGFKVLKRAKAFAGLCEKIIANPS